MRNVIKTSSVTWVDIQNPAKQDVKYLKDTFQIHPTILAELIPVAWRAKVEVFPSYLFLVLSYPVYSKERKETRPRHLDLIFPNIVFGSSSS